MYILLCIEEIINKDQLYSAAKTLYLIMSYNEKNLKEYVYIHIWEVGIHVCVYLSESPCCTPEANTILSINYTPTQNFRKQLVNSKHWRRPHYPSRAFAVEGSASWSPHHLCSHKSSPTNCSMPVVSSGCWQRWLPPFLETKPTEIIFPLHAHFPFLNSA